MVYYPLAVRAHVQSWPRFFFLVFCPPPPPLSLFVLMDRAANVSAWAVKEAVIYFTTTLISLRYLLAPIVVTALAA